MGSLSELLSQIPNIPPEELEPRKTEAERPTEMQLTSYVISKAEILKLQEGHPARAKITRACFKRNDRFEMVFHIPNGGLHKVVASYGSSGLIVTDNDKSVTINDSVEELHNYLVGLAKDIPKAGA